MLGLQDSSAKMEKVSEATFNEQQHHNIGEYLPSKNIYACLMTNLYK